MDRVHPHSEHKKRYLDIAASLRPEFKEKDGFISVERFQSLTDETKILSISFFCDEAAIQQWRNISAHCEAQAMGRRSIFKDYRIRIASVIRDYGLDERE